MAINDDRREKGAAFLDRMARERGVIKSPKALMPLAEKLWKEGLRPGDSTGWPNVDKHYTVKPGQLTIITGWPSSGKSEWLDAMLVNLSKKDWKFVLFSPENHPVELHMAKLLEKISGQPFGDGPSQRIPYAELAEHIDTLDQSFRFMLVPEDNNGTLGPLSILESAETAFRAFPAGSKRGLVIDPWNEIENLRPPHMAETEHISAVLSGLRAWARNTGTHVWIVAHPAKQRRENGVLPIPTPDMISGSQHWWNKADNAITVYRDLSSSDALVQIHVQKVRFKHVGRAGIVDLTWNRINGRYSVPLQVVQKAGNDYRSAREGE